MTERESIGALVKFHTRHKLLIMSHSVQHYRDMGRLVAHAKKKTIKILFEQYQDLLMAAMRLKTTMKKNVNVLQHMLGYFKKDLTRDEKQELLEVFDTYRKGHVPLIVPVRYLGAFCPFVFARSMSSQSSVSSSSPSSTSTENRRGINP